MFSKRVREKSWCSVVLFLLVLFTYLKNAFASGGGETNRHAFRGGGSDLIEFVSSEWMMDLTKMVDGRQLHTIEENVTFQFTWSCENSKYTKVMHTCDMVNWRSAQVSRRMLAPNGSPVFNWEEIDFGLLDAFVDHIYESGSEDFFLPQTDGAPCGYDRLRALCGYFFRRCRYGNDAMVPSDMCVSVCQDYRSDCLVGANANTIEAPICDNVFPPTAYSWDCSNNGILEENSNCASIQPANECVLVPHEGYFLLDIEYGPYDTLPEITLTFIVAWMIASTLWILYSLHLSFHNEESCNSLTRSVLILPLFMCSYLIVSYFFWATCDHWGECSYWLSVGQANCKLIWEATLFLVLLLCGKGWFIHRHGLSQFELRRMVLLVCLFYLADSLLMVLQEYVRWFYWCLLTFLYTFVLFYILGNTRKILDRYSKTLLQVDMDSDAYRIFMAKLRYFLNFRIVVVVYVVVFIVVQGLQHSVRNSPLWPLIVAQYVADLLLFLAIMYLIRAPNPSDLFSTIGTDDVFGGDNFDGLAPMVVANMNEKRAMLAPTRPIGRGNHSRGTSEAGMQTKASVSPALTMRKRTLSWLSPQTRDKRKSETYRVVAPVVVVRNPGGEFDLAIGVKVEYVSKFKDSKSASNRTNSDRYADDNDGDDELP